MKEELIIKKEYKLSHFEHLTIHQISINKFIPNKANFDTINRLYRIGILGINFKSGAYFIKPNRG